MQNCQAWQVRWHLGKCLLSPPSDAVGLRGHTMLHFLLSPYSDAPDLLLGINPLGLYTRWQASCQRELRCPTRAQAFWSPISKFTHTVSDWGLRRTMRNKSSLFSNSLAQDPSSHGWRPGLGSVSPWGGQVVPGHTVCSPAFSSPSPKWMSGCNAAQTLRLPTSSHKPAVPGSTRTHYLQNSLQGLFLIIKVTPIHLEN